MLLLASHCKGGGTTPDSNLKKTDPHLEPEFDVNFFYFDIKVNIIDILMLYYYFAQ